MSDRREPDTPTGSVVWDREAMLDLLMGDEDLARSILDGFLEDIPQRLEMLREGLDRGDLAEAGLQAHTVKGAALSVGAEALRAAAFEVERAARAGDAAEARDRLGEVLRQYGLLEERIRP